MRTDQQTRRAPRRAPVPSHAEAQLRAILDTAVDAIIVINQAGIIETFNRAAQRMFGYEAQEAVGQNVSILMPEPYRSAHGGYLADYLHTGRARIIGIGREAVGQRKNGQTFPISLAVSEVLEGRRRSFAGIIRDISEQKQLERDILDVSELEQRRIGQDLHDGLCQELAGIGFLVKSIQQKLQARGSVNPAEAAQVTMLLEDAVRHAKGLSHSLYPVDPQPNGLMVALTKLAANTADVFKITCEFRCNRPVEIRDPSAATHLYRIAQEAVRDAIRHGKAGRITIELTPRRGAIELVVSDDGVPLSADGRHREQTLLRMMHQRAAVIGGKLRIESRRGGTSVRCEFPHSKPAF